MTIIPQNSVFSVQNGAFPNGDSVSGDGTLNASSKEIGARLEDLAFRFPLRRYQKEILDLVDDKLSNGDRQLHLVAPPGAGKTIIGLQLITNFKKPSLILCPNTTIQSQWGQKLDLFVPPEIAQWGATNLIGTHEDKPLKPITVLTYQVLSTPGREKEYLEKLAHTEWSKEISKGRQLTGGESELRILEIMQNNPRQYEKEISRHVSRLRKKLSDIMDLSDVLHPNALDLLQTMRRQKFGVVIFDECHHLTDYWAAIMTHLVRYLDDPVVIGLTGTPPEGKSQSQETRYMTLVGEIDYQVPTPALVKEGGLAPFQDLVYFTHPTENELSYLEQQHDDFHDLIADLTGEESLRTVAAQRQPPAIDQAIDQNQGQGQGQVQGQIQGQAQRTNHYPSDEDDMYAPGIITGGSGDDFYAIDPEIPDATEGEAAGESLATLQEQTKPDLDTASLTDWVLSRLGETFYDQSSKSFRSFMHSRPHLAVSFYRYLYKLGRRPPASIPVSEEILQAPAIDDWMAILEDFASHKLKTSKRKEDHLTYERIRAACRKLGFGITEQGLRKQASPIDRVLAFSLSKSEAVCRILECEYANLQDHLRAVVVTDFERMSATTARALKGVIDEETGGAVAVLRTLLKSPVAAYLNPCLVTGSLLLVDKRIKDQFVCALEEMLNRDDLKITLNVIEKEDLPYVEISATSTQWESRLYVAYATHIFERGITRLLIGTRGLFGEGWDSQSLNTLIDLTTTTSPVSVKQLRGRSLRIHTNDPLGGRKVANNWDVVCIAPSLEKGLNDYQRFVRKHQGFFGIADDGQIESGVGHVHPAFSDLTPVEVFASAETFNDEMLSRALVRDKIYELWKVGGQYNNRMLGCVDLMKVRNPSLTPPHLKRNMKYREHARELRASLNGVIVEHGALGAAVSGLTAAVLAYCGVTALPAILPLVAFACLASKNYRRLFARHLNDVCEPYSVEATLKDMAMALLVTMQKLKLLPGGIDRESLKVSVRSDGSYRVFLDDVEPEHSRVFTGALKEMMLPVTGQPYLMPKYEYSLPKTGRSSWLGNEKDRKSEFFNLYLKEKAVPRIAAYHPVPKLVARSAKGREAFQAAWNKYVSPGFLIETEKRPKVLDKHFGIGPSLAERLLWE